MEANTDREILIRLDGQIERLSESIERLGKSIEDMEEKKIAVIEKKIEDLLSWREQIKGGWKLAMLFWGLAAVGIGLIVKHFMK
jgi:hypothetical protein